MERALSQVRDLRIHARKRRQTKYPKQLRAVTFDVGGTLIECWPSVGHIYAEAAAGYGHRLLSPSVLNRRFRRAWTQFEGFRHTRADWSALVDTTFRDLIEELPSRTFFPKLFNRFSEPDVWHVFEDVLPTLRGLKSRGLKLGIISNWDHRLRPLLTGLKLDSHFETIVISCEVGAHKPDGRIFHSACAALGTEPAETLHIGDSRKMDFEGARAAGLRAFWLARGPRRAHGSIRSLRELHKL